MSLFTAFFGKKITTEIRIYPISGLSGIYKPTTVHYLRHSVQGTHRKMYSDLELRRNA